jgi:polygalacturonase
MRQTCFNARDFGALGNGRETDTAALQRALDACSAGGGGRVLVPAGAYLSGTLELKRHTELHLAPGAMLLASPDRAHYRRVHDGNGWVARGNLIPFNHDEHFIVARDAVNVSITGTGTIDGNGRTWMVLQHPKGGLTFRDWRPGPLVAFVRCEDVRMRDVTLKDSPSFTVWTVGCQRVMLSGLTIRNVRETPNADGIHVSCSRDVRIGDCSIDAGDDCLCFYTMPYWLKTSRPCENVVVTNCALRTKCCGVRIGFTGDAPLRNMTFSNLVMHDTQTGLDLLVNRSSAWRMDDVEEPSRHGPLIENVSFSNLVMDTNKAIYFWVADKAQAPAGIHNISVSNVLAATTHACYLGGSPRVPIEDVRFDNIELTMRGAVDDRFRDGVPYPVSAWGAPGIPHAWYIRHARRVALNNVRVQWGDVTGPWRSAVRAEQVEDLDLNGLVAGHAPGPSDAATIHLTNARGASLRGCRAVAGTDTWLRVDDERTSDITLAGNDLGRAREAGTP